MRRPPLNTDPRRGLSLIEVLVAFFVLIIGVVAVITLFPVGVMQVRQAAIDTRVTNLGVEAAATIQAYNWPDNVYIVRPPHQGHQGAGDPPNPPKVGAGADLPEGGDPRGIVQQTTAVYTNTDPVVGSRPAVGQVDNAYAVIPYPNGKMPQLWLPPPATPTLDQMRRRMASPNGPGPGFPVFVDPTLYNFHQFQKVAGSTDFDQAPPYKRVVIGDGFGGGTLGQTYPSQPPFAGTLNDLPIYTLSDVQWTPAAPLGSNYSEGQFTRRDAALRRLFYAKDDLQFEEANPVLPYHPNRSIMVGNDEGWKYVYSTEPPGDNARSDDASIPRATAASNRQYSFAFVVKNRQMIADGLSMVPAAWDPTNIQVLVFHKRPLTARPYMVVAGCLFAGSNKVTLSWGKDSNDQDLPGPNLTKGMYLMEATLSPGARDTTPQNGIIAGFPPLPPAAAFNVAPSGGNPARTYTKYRHAIEFHQIESYNEPRLNAADGRTYQVVTLREPVGNFPIRHRDGDGRAMPDIYNGETFTGQWAYPTQMPGAKENGGGGGGGNNVDSIWVPIVFHHGLQEVFQVRN